MEQDKILNYFSILKKHEIIGKSYLFVGDNFLLVKDIAKLVNCQEHKNSFCDSCWDCKKIEEGSHPDVFIVEPKTLSITIDSIRDCQQFLRLKSFRAKQKIVIIKEAETIAETAASAFLKTLEEPPKNSLIFICTSKLEGLLPTIISRCRKVFLPFAEEEIEKSSIKYIFDFLKGEKLEFKDRSNFKAFLWTLIVILRDHMVSAVTHENRLLKAKDCEIILPLLQGRKAYTIEQQGDILKDILKVYSAYNTINENLALNLIRAKMDYTD